MGRFMSLSAVLFDLDGTLLPMDNDEFTRQYFKLLAAKMAPYGYDPRKLVDSVWAGTAAMVNNDGRCSNEEAFWKKFAECEGERVYGDKPVFEEFYRNEFNRAAAFCGVNPAAAGLVAGLRLSGIRMILATNPIFPEIATMNRIGWAGLEPGDFELITTYENFQYCKPNPEYYREIARRRDLVPEECLMVGNDVLEDMTAEETGMRVFLLTDYLINRKEADISRWPNGGFNELSSFAGTLARES